MELHQQIARYQHPFVSPSHRTHFSPKTTNRRSPDVYIHITFVFKIKLFLPVLATSCNSLTISVAVTLQGFFCLCPIFYFSLSILSVLNPSESILSLFSLFFHYSQSRPHNFAALTFLPFKASCNFCNFSIYKPCFNPAPHEEPRSLDQLGLILAYSGMPEICRRGKRVTSAVSGSCLELASLQVFCPVPTLRFHFGQIQEHLWGFLIWEQKHRAQKWELREGIDGGKCNP